MRAPKPTLIPATALAMLGATLLAACGASHSPGGAYPAAAVKVVTLRSQAVTLTRELPATRVPFSSPRSAPR